jgi:hypothetical protein
VVLPAVRENDSQTPKQPEGRWEVMRLIEMPTCSGICKKCRSSLRPYLGKENCHGVLYSLWHAA